MASVHEVYKKWCAVTKTKGHGRFIGMVWEAFEAGFERGVESVGKEERMAEVFRYLKTRGHDITVDAHLGVILLTGSKLSEEELAEVRRINEAQ